MLRYVVILERFKDLFESFSRTFRRKPFQIIDSWPLWLHYTASVSLFAFFFIGSTTSWYLSWPMQCVNKFDRSEVWDYFKDLCLSYSYANPKRFSLDESARVCAAHYRWIHWVFLFLTLIYGLPL